MTFANRFPAQTRVGSLVSLPLRLIPPKAIVCVLWGPCKGCRWGTGAGVDGYWLGNFEPSTVDFAVRALRSGDVFLDVGANVGYFTLAAARAVGPAGRVVAFEPLPRNV